MGSPLKVLVAGWHAFMSGLRVGWRIPPDSARRLYEQGKIDRAEYTAHLESWWNDDEWEDGDGND